MCTLGRRTEQDCAAFRCNAAMRRRKRAIRGVAPLTQQVNIPSAENTHIFRILNITNSDQLVILGASFHSLDDCLLSYRKLAAEKIHFFNP